MSSPTAPASRFRYSKIGLGTATFGREIDRDAAFAFMDHAVAHGVNHIDTAAKYSSGESERIVGQWLTSRRPLPGSLLIATKAWFPYTPESVLTSLENSLRFLGVDAIDVYYFHQWEAGALNPAVREVLERFVRAGQVRALGVSNFNLGQLQQVQRLQTEAGFTRITALQNNNNYAIRHIDDELKGFCAQEGIDILTFSPLGAGFLTGKHRQGVVPGSRFDLVKNNPKNYFTDEAWGRLDRLEAVAKKHGVSLTVLAMAWALHQPGVASVLVGGRIPAHLDQAFAGLKLDRTEIWHELEQQ